MSNRITIIHNKFQHCNTDDRVSFTDVWKTHWALGHPVQSANVSGSHVSYDVNILPVNGLIQVSERHALTTLYFSFTLDAIDVDTVIIHNIIIVWVMLWIVRINSADPMHLIFLIASITSFIPSLIQLVK